MKTVIGQSKMEYEIIVQDETPRSESMQTITEEENKYELNCD